MPRALQLREFSIPDYLKNLSLVDVPKPEVSGPKDVIVRIKARPINVSDIRSCQGLYPNFKPAAWPCVPGFESTGIVEEVGKDVQMVKVGQRVTPILGMYAFAGAGTWQEYAKCTEFECVPVPDHVPDEVACQYLVNPFTAVGLLEILKVPKGEYLLQTSANSALGQIIVQYSKHIGVKTINVVRNSIHSTTLNSLGADEVINMAEEDVQARVMEITGNKGAYAAIDSLAGEMTGQLAASVREHGEVVVIGAMTGQPHSVSAADIVFRDVKLSGFYLGRWLFGQKPEAERYALFPQVMEWIATGVIKPPVGKTFDLADYESAIEASLAPGQNGKVILVG